MKLSERAVAEQGHTVKLQHGASCMCLEAVRVSEGQRGKADPGHLRAPMPKQA